MDAVADYAAALRMLDRPRPAYISYVEHTYGKAGGFTKGESQTIVIRTRDGVVLRGDPGKIEIKTDQDVQVNPITHPPFDANCYAARTATMLPWEGRTVEAISLRETCPRHEHDAPDFETIYLDPQTREPLAAEGLDVDDPVTVTLEQRYGRVDRDILPVEILIHIQGHGMLGMLNVSAGQQYTDYRFLERYP